MALKKSQQIKGITADYWKVSTAKYNNIFKVLDITVVLFANHESASNPVNSFTQKMFSVEVPANDIDTNVVAFAYDKLKEDAFFTGAIDV